MTKYVLHIFFIVLVAQTYSQSIEEIKDNAQHYIWAEGKGMTLNEADKDALDQLSSQISTTVESNFEQNKSQIEADGDYNFQSKVKSIVKTYSNATLTNATRLIIQNEPDAHVFRFIKRADVKKIFEARANKIRQFFQQALKAKQKLKIGDALKYFYWTNVLLQSHPFANSITFENEAGEEELILPLIAMRMNELFGDLRFVEWEREQKEGGVELKVKLSYNGMPVDQIDFSYWDGMNWSNLISARDGKALLIFYDTRTAPESLKVKVEYIYENESLVDRELSRVMETTKHVPFRKAYTQVEQTKSEEIAETQAKQTKINDFKQPSTEQKSLVATVLDLIEARKYKKAMPYFTKQAYRNFLKLVRYGKAKLVDRDHIEYFSLGGYDYARNILMQFKFKSNHKEFTENVSFQLRGDKIQSVAFGLSSIAQNSIAKKTIWSQEDRMALINFLEDYKTSYALKNLAYINQVFAEDALIITGRVLKVKPNSENNYQSELVQYTRHSKQDYLKKLSYAFKSKEYINLKFEESHIRKSGIEDVYGIQIKQNYSSSNYGDTGHLFLMVDLNNKEEPIIQVRTWQPELKIGEMPYSLGDF